jgi:hypothetical protein
MSKANDEKVVVQIPKGRDFEQQSQKHELRRARKIISTANQQFA